MFRVNLRLKLVMISLLLVFSVNVFANEGEYQDQYYEEVETAPGQLEEDVDDLTSLEELKDIAVIQKKYLDKTKRFELFGALNVVLNSQYFNLLGFNLAGAYHFNERWGVELQGMFLSEMEKSVTKGLKTDIGIETEDIVTVKSYYGVNLRWSPIYGKLSLREKTINPFEIYFTLGLGMTKTETTSGAFTVHAGVGQVYPMSKNTTFRWGLGFNNFSAEADSKVKGNLKGQEVNASLFYLSAGMSLYFPFRDSR